MTPRVLSYRSNIISGRATVATGKLGPMRLCGGCAGAIGFAFGVATRCRSTSALMRDIVAKAVARVPQGGGAILEFSRVFLAFSKAATSPLAKADCRAVQMLRALISPNDYKIACQT